MRRQRSKLSGAFASRPDNIISLESRRNRRASIPMGRVAYLGNNSEIFQSLNQCQLLAITYVRSLTRLNALLMVEEPDVVIVDSSLDIACPTSVIELISARTNVPVVMIYDREDIRKNPNLVRDAFTAGVFDTLAHPATHDEIYSAVEVLLKFKLQASL